MRKKSLISFVFLLPMAVQAQAPFVPGAVNPVYDPGGVAQTIKDNYDKIEQHTKRMSVLQADMTLSGLMVESRVDATNNATANAITRLNQQRADIHNLEAAQQAQPAMYACAPVGISISLEDALCDQLDLIAERSNDADRISLSSAPSLQFAITGIPSPQDASSLPFEMPDTKTLSLQSLSALMGSPPSHDEQLSLDLRDVITVVMPSYRPSQARRQWGESETLMEMQSIALTNLPRKAVESVAARRYGGSGISEAGAINLFGEEHFSDERITDLTTNQALSEDAVWRERYTSRAFMVWRSVNEFELSLEHEMLLAVRLARAANSNEQ